MLAIYSKLSESFMALFRDPKSIKLARSTTFSDEELSSLDTFLSSYSVAVRTLFCYKISQLHAFELFDKSTLTETTKTHCCLAISGLYWKNQKFDTFIEILFLFLELWNLNFLLVSYGFLVALLLQKSQHSFWNTLYKGVYKKLV